MGDWTKKKDVNADHGIYYARHDEISDTLHKLHLASHEEVTFELTSTSLIVKKVGTIFDKEIGNYNLDILPKMLQKMQKDDGGPAPEKFFLLGLTLNLRSCQNIDEIKAKLEHFS